MAGRRRGTGPGTGIARRAEAAQRREVSSTRRTRSSARQEDVPVYTQLLRESSALRNRMTSDEPERPLKRRRTGRRTLESAPKVQTTDESARDREEESDSDEDDADIEFEDVEIPKPTLQTTYRDSSDGESEDDVQFEDVDLGAITLNKGQTEEKSDTLELNLTAAKEALTPSRRNADRRKPIGKEEKECRFDIHRIHLLCLLAHAEKKNHWCNDPVVQANLQPLLTAKIVQWLNPASHLTQFGQTESFKKGLEMIMDRFQQRYNITERGLRRSLWAEDVKQLEDYGLPDDIDSCLEKADFRRAARNLSGSRDAGAQLFCAILRAAGVEARLVFSLQPLGFVPGGPAMPKLRQAKAPSRSAPARIEAVQAVTSPSTSIPSPRSRLGHPNATAYLVPDISAVPSSSSRRTPPRQPRPSESEYPVFWVEVLDAAHQKWQPVDPFVPRTLFRANKLEPPASDRRNCLSYVVCFEEGGAAKDVTRRYAKAFNAKTRRMRVDGPMVPEEGRKWWRRVLKRYRTPGLITDLDQIENNELNGLEAREPLPRNVIDFKNHPIYALQRHLRRHEVLVPGASIVGTVGAGSKGPLEKIYRRKDVRVARSADKWYRSGREIKLGEEPVKVLPRRKKPQKRGRLAFDEEDESSDDDPVLGPGLAKGVPIYTFDQTQLYIPPPVVAGRIPKNKFGNLDTYVPSMVPAGGAHVVHPRAGHAAHVLGVDYAPALTGFDWKGRKGTAVYSGVVVPAEAEEGMRAVIEGFEDLEQMLEEERRGLRALATWKKLLRGLRIRKSVFAGEEMFDESEPLEDIPVGEDEGMNDAEADREGGGFVPDYERAGGFEPGGFEPGGFEPGGFEPSGFEPSGSEPGGFEPGGFENTIDDKGKGKGKELETRGSDHHDTSEPEPAYSARRLRPMRRRLMEIDEEKDNEEPATGISLDAGQLKYLEAPDSEPATKVHDSKADNDEEDGLRLMVETSIAIGTPVSDETGQPDAQPGGLESVADPAVSDEQLDQCEMNFPGANGESSVHQDSPNASRHGGETQHPAIRALSDTELDEADSDTTEELYMDEDGALID